MKVVFWGSYGYLKKFLKIKIQVKASMAMSPETKLVDGHHTKE